MSTEGNLRLKLSKKLKIAFAKVKSPDRRTKRAKSILDTNEPYVQGNLVRRNYKSTKSKKAHVGGQDASESDVDGGRNAEPVNSDRKRRRVYANQLVNEKELANGTMNPDRNASLKRRQTEVTDGSTKWKLSAQPQRSIWVSRREEAFTSKAKRSSQQVEDASEIEEVFSHNQCAKMKPKNKQDGGRNGMLNKHTKSELSRKCLEQDRVKGSDLNPSTLAIKTVRNKNALAARKSEVLDDQLKKRKHVIRLDPYDTSNKRLDDGLVTCESSKEKELEKDAEMSKNAKFRAIKPSPSILFYVEDNLLGRRRSIELKRAGYNIELSAPLDNIPFSTSTEREQIEENIFRNKLTFFAAAKVSSSFPAPNLPEIAFAGRSNVGKSSLLNSLTRRWGVARTSDKPGLTQTINFFKLGSKLCLVDLPGYGFAYAKEEVKDAWEELVKEYVSTRVGLKQVCLLIDTKWGMKPRDHELVDLMERSQTKYQIVLTKTDLVFPIDVSCRAMQIEESLKANKSLVQPVMMVSSKSGAGIRSLRTVLSKIARFTKF